tara:strand:- start:188 stop:418 length:231 start_codon:yes stop_codon:yes gene_type:complete
MLVGTSDGFTQLSNDNFWDPKNIQLTEKNLEKSTNRPGINIKILRLNKERFGKFIAKQKVTSEKLSDCRRESFFDD